MKAKGFFRNLRISAMMTGGMADEKKKTLLLRAPLVAIGAQKELWEMSGKRRTKFIMTMPQATPPGYPRANPRLPL